MLWLALNFYQLPMDVFVREQDENIEFALIENGKLCYCNQQAMNKGLEPGMKVSTAYALSHEIQIKKRDYDLEANTLNQLAIIAYQFSSQVCLYDQQTILLEVEASYRLFKNLPCLLEELASKLKSDFNHYYVACGATAKSAYLLCGYQKIAIEHFIQSIDGFSSMEIKQFCEELLNDIPIERLTIEPTIDLTRIAKKMGKMGIRQLKEVLQLPTSSIGRRFGKDFLSYLFRLKGDLSDPLSLFDLPETFSIQRCFLEGLDTVEQILFPAKPMIEQLFFFLKSRRVMATEIRWYFICFNGDELFFEINLSSEVQTISQLMMLTRLKLQSFVFQEKIETIFLQTESFLSLQENQKSLLVFDTNQMGEDENSQSLMDCLNARLVNKTNLFNVFLCDEYLPEKCSKTVNASIAALSKQDRSELLIESLIVETSIVEQPLWILGEKQKKSIKLNNERLNYRGWLNFQSKAERIENGWWDRAARRDYYMMSNQKGVCYWVYCDLITQQWFVHGVF